jgi:phospholipid transport system substrate-binding protein
MNSGFETADPHMLTSISLPRRTLLGCLVAGLAVAPRLARADSATDQAMAFVTKSGNDLIGVVNGPGSTAAKGAAMQAIIDRTVDVTSVGRFCLGRFWRTATPEQQKDYLDLFHHSLVLNITSKVGEYQGVTITFSRAIARDDGVVVSSIVTRPNTAPSKVDWLVSTESGAPRIVDVIAEGTSLRLTQRNDYAAYMSRNGNSVLALIDALKKQAVTPAAG